MTETKYKVLLAGCLCIVALGLFAFKGTFASMAASLMIAYEEKQTIRLEAKKAEEAASLAAKEAEEAASLAAKETEEAARAELELMTRRAAIPEFSFNGFRLSDTPQQVIVNGRDRHKKITTSFPVEQANIGAPLNLRSLFKPSDTPQQVIDKGGGKYKIITPFPVEQSEITVTSNRQNFGVIEIDIDSPLDQFFSRHQKLSDGYNLEASNRNIASALQLQIDSIDLQEENDKDTGIDNIRLYYFMLPDSSPKALYMRVTGTIVHHVPEVFGKRYGDPEYMA
jgi:hypothetical protein